MAAGSIIIDLLMRTGSFETDTKRASAALRKMEKEAIDVGKKIGAALGVAAAATAYFIKASADAADAAYKSAQSIGLTVEAYTSLAFAADLSGTSQEELGVALTKLARQASDAAGGSKTAAAGFDAMGISLKNADGAIKDTDQLLTEIAEKFKGYADGTEKTALATEIFGRAGAKMIPMLNSGKEGIEAMRKEAAELGLVMDTQTAKAAEHFNDDLARLGGAMQGFGNDLLRLVLPALNDLTDLLIDVAKESRAAGDATSVMESVFRGVLNVFQVLAVIGSDLIFILKGTGREIGALAAQAVALAKLDIQGFRAISDAVSEDAERARKELDAFQARVMALGTGNSRMADSLGLDSPLLAAPRPTTRAPTPASGGGSTGAKSADRAAQYTEQLRKQLEGTQDLTAAEKVLADIRAGSLGRVTAAQEQTLLGLAREIDATKEAQRVARERADARNKENEAIERWARENEEADRQRLKSLTSGTESARLKEATADIRFLNEQYDKGNILVEAWADAIRKSTAELGAQAQALDTFTQQAAENFQSFLGGALADAFEGNFNDIGKGFTRMINRMVAEALAADIARKMFGGDAKGGSGEGWIGAALSWAGSMFGGGKAGGGDVMPGREYWVGERGPERFRPRSMGTILPAGAGPSPAGRSFQQTLNISVQGQVTARTAAQIGAEAGRALRRAERMNA